MRIALEARGLTARGAGTRRYVSELVRHLIMLRGGDTFATLEKGPVHELLLPWWINYTVPRWLQHVHPDLVHFMKAAIPARKRFPTVVTIYDVIPLLFPESQKISGRMYWPRTLRHAALESDHIVTISEASKRDIVEQLGVTEAKVTVTPLAVDTAMFRLPASSRQLNGQPATDFVRRVSGGVPYVLFVGTIEPRKNVPLLVRSFVRIAADLPHRLIIAGRVYKGGAEAAAAIAASGVKGRIVQLPFVPAEELPALYSNADAFVWPSVYEGWGFPPQEAMACGTPVIVSDGGSLPEVVGEAGMVVPFAAPLRERTSDADFEQRLAEAMRAVLESETRQTAMRQEGLEQAARFSWRRVAEQTIDVYHRVA